MKGVDTQIFKNLCLLSSLSDTVNQSRLLNTHCGLGSTIIKPGGYNLSSQETVKYVTDYREVC